MECFCPAGKSEQLQQVGKQSSEESESESHLSFARIYLVLYLPQKRNICVRRTKHYKVPNPTVKKFENTRRR